MILLVFFSTATLPSIPQGFAMANDVQFAKVSKKLCPQDENKAKLELVIIPLPRLVSALFYT